MIHRRESFLYGILEGEFLNISSTLSDQTMVSPSTYLIQVPFTFIIVTTVLGANVIILVSS